jgi:AcrR family transcriptional regulator
VREKLIASALALMDEGGLDAVKARSVAQAVGVSVGTVYNLFGSVDGLLLAANLTILEALNALGRERAGAQRGGEQVGASGRVLTLGRLLGLSAAYIDFVAANANRWAALLAFNRSRKLAETDRTYVARQDALIDIVGEVLRTTPLGDNGPRRRVAARALWSSVHGIVTMNYFGADEAGARQRTWAQIEWLVTAAVDGLYAAKA